ncbi:nitroreductase/quinone reductase family protein [Natrarchaeobius sp. A-rgal3]|uniref:nitroreductase/quinone reductase family protein n=1 Tax=Natrarchaeobius versutus TaxID=1679078 RepID=UPI00350F2869
MAGGRVRSLGRRFEHRVVNPFVQWILRSPVHWPMSRWLTILTYEGRHSGRSFSTPVLYRRDGDSIVLLTPTEQTNWWKNFRGGHPLSLLIRGKRLTGTGRVETDDEVVLETVRWAASLLRLASAVIPGRTIPSEYRLREKAAEFVVVVVTFDEGWSDQQGSISG